MFKRFYDAGHSFAENTVQALVKKLPLKKMDEKEKTYLSGVLGIAAGNFVKTVGYIGLGLTGLAAIAVGFSTGLALPAMLAYAAVGTAFALAGTFGKGMEDGGDKISGLLTFCRQFSPPLASFAAEKFRNWRKPKISGEFKAAVQPAAPVAAAPAVAPVAIPATVPAASPASTTSNTP